MNYRISSIVSFHSFGTKDTKGNIESLIGMIYKIDNTKRFVFILVPKYSKKIFYKKCDFEKFLKEKIFLIKSY